MGDHPGEGEILVVDAHPEFQHAYDGSDPADQVLTADSAFSRKATPTQLHYQGKRVDRGAAGPAGVRRHTLDWWFPGDEHGFR